MDEPRELHELTGVPDPPRPEARPRDVFGRDDPVPAMLERLLPWFLGLIVGVGICHAMDWPGVSWVLVWVALGSLAAAPLLSRWRVRVAAQRLEQVVERSRHELLGRRYRHVPPAAVSPAHLADEPVEARGLSRSDETAS